MCSKGGGSPPVPSAASTTFNSTTQPSAFAGGLYTDFLNRANSLSTTPFNPGQLGTVAPMTAEQTTAGNQLFNLGMDMGNFDPAKVQSIMSPFTESVVGATQNWFNNQNAIQGNDLLGQGIRAGNAFGGDREGIAAAQLAGQQQLAQAPVIAGLRQAGYTQALDEYNRLKTMGLQGAGAALGWGTMEQQQAQKQFDVAQQNAMMQSAYPFQTLNWYGSLLGGIAPLLGQTAFGSNNPPAGNTTAAALGAGAAGIGLIGSALGGGSGPTGAGQKRGGIIRHRARAGLVPVYIRHNGGIIAGLAYGGDPDDSDKDQAPPSRYSSSDVYQSDEGDQARESKQGDYSSRQSEFSTATPRRPTSPDFGLTKGWTKPTSQGPQFPVQTGSGAATTASGQPTTSDWLKFGSSVGSLAAKALPLLLAKRGAYVRGYADGDEVLSDEAPDPIAPGQQFARDYSGNTTWFNPRNERGGYTYTDDSGRSWTDTGAQRLREGPHASGLPSTTPGFASPGSADLGNWFRLNLPGRNQPVYAQKTDIGPPGVIDLNAPLAAREGYSPNTVGGRTSVVDLGREQPPEAGGVKWPSASEGNVIPEGGLPTGRPPATPERVPGERMGREPTAAGAPERGPRYADAGTGAVGTQIPNAPPRKAETFAQRLAQNPFWQFGTALMKNPGQRSDVGFLQALGGAAQSMSKQQMDERNRVLDEKPKLIDVGGMMHWQTADGQLIPTGMKSIAGKQEERAGRKEAREGALPDYEIEQPGEGLFGEKTKKQYKVNPDTGKLEEWIPPKGATSTKQDIITPDQRPAQPQAPPQPPAQQQQPPPPAPAPGQQQQPPAPAVPSVQRPPPRQTAAEPEQPPPAQGAPAVPPGGRTGGAQLPQVAQAQQPAAGAGPAAGPYDPEAEWKKITPVGVPTNPGAAAANRNEDAIAAGTPKEQNLIKGLVDYKINPKDIPMRDPKTGVTRAKVLEAATAYDRDYNPALYPAKAQALKEFGVNGAAQKSLQSNNMVLEHIGDAMTAVDKLGNSTIPLYNKITGQWQYQTGNEKYQAAMSEVRAKVEAAATEAARTFRGVGAMSEREQQHWRSILLAIGKGDEIPTASPVTMRAALVSLADLVHGRLDATVNAHNQIMGPDYYRDDMSWMTPKAQETFARARATNPEENQPFPPSKYAPSRVTKGGGGTEQGPAEQAPVQVQSIDEARKLGPGRKFIIPDGPNKGMIGTVPGAP